ncbi:hypothetical protein LTS08_000071 [Lithohypha guttulata]|nr:hypothetical protein LTS08_000071 [Lithohypha guttulata]
MNLLFLQILAKIHELLIHASLSVIVFHAVRYELLFGDGLPLGLLGSGFSFTTIEYFFNKKFLAAALGWFNRRQAQRKICFLALLVISGTIAPLAGPASATLLVPKSQSWPSGGTEYFLDGSTNDFWPVDMSGDMATLQTLCNSNNSDALSLSGSNFYWPIHSPSSHIPPRYALGEARLDDKSRSNTWLVIPHAAPVALSQQVMVDWWAAVAPDDITQPSKIDDRQASTTHLNAITNARCSPPQELSATDSVVLFPSLRGRFDYAEPQKLSIGDLATVPTDHLSFRWIHLPDEFGALSIGGLFESAWNNNHSRIVIGCSAQAGWVPAQAKTDEYAFWTGWYPWNITFGGRVPFFNAVAPGEPLGLTNGRVALGDAWLALLTPPANTKVLTSRNSKPSTIEVILEGAGLDDRLDIVEGQNLTEKWSARTSSNGTRTRLIEAIICSVVADGLSRYGSHMVYENATNPMDLSLRSYERLPGFKHRIEKGARALSIPNAPEGQTTTLRVDMQITGFSIRISLAGYLAMSVLMAHMLLAIGHVIWMISKRETSGCWSLVTDIITLAYNSRTVAPCLKNTGAGVERRSTVRQVARILARPHPETCAMDRVELVFTDSADIDGKPCLLEAEMGDVAYDSRESSAYKTEPRDSSSVLDERVYTTAKDTLLAKATLAKRKGFEQVQVGRKYC